MYSIMWLHCVVCYRKNNMTQNNLLDAAHAGVGLQYLLGIVDRIGGSKNNASFYHSFLAVIITLYSAQTFFSPTISFHINFISLMENKSKR